MKKESTRSLTTACMISALLLVLLLAGYWFYVDFFNPPPFYTKKYDPEMAYMLNSLGIFKSNPYAYFDHPGTPVEIIGTVILALMRPFTGLNSSAYWTHVLANPTYFLKPAHGFLTLSSIVVAFGLTYWAIKVRDRSDIILAFAIGVSFYAVIRSITFESLNMWTQNSFNFPFGTSLLFALLLRMRSPKKLELWEVSLFGLLAGVLTAVQLYFATWIIGIGIAVVLYLLFQGHRVWSAVKYGSTIGIGAFLGFFIATLPIIHKYREFTWWLRRLVFHQGRYGSGPPGFTSIESLISNFKELWGAQYVIFIAYGLLLILLAASMYVNKSTLRIKSNWWALAFGMVVQSLVTILLVLKHPHRNYLLSLAATFPIFLTLSFSTIKDRGSIAKRVCVAISIAFICGFGWSYASAIEHNNTLIVTVDSMEKTLQGYVSSYAEESGLDPEDVKILWAYGSYSPCFALRFGNNYADQVFTDEINQICPNQLRFDIWSEKAILPEGPRSLSESDNWDVLILSSRYLIENHEEFGEIYFSPDEETVFIFANRSE
jgi:hypothetical protein